jgi:hypothetical protein
VNEALVTRAVFVVTVIVAVSCVGVKTVTPVGVGLNCALYVAVTTQFVELLDDWTMKPSVNESDRVVAGL